FSLAIGGSILVPSTTSRRDFATEHLGSVDWQAHVAIGKERFSRACLWWTQRVWGVGAIAWSTRGAPQLRGKVAWAVNWCDRGWAEAFITGLYGLGHHKLSAFVPFAGYAPFATRAVDFGILIAQCLGDLGEGRLLYAYRPYARNYPESAHTVS